MSEINAFLHSVFDCPLVNNMMDPSIGWFQPENKGPALTLWVKLWKSFNCKTSDNRSAIEEENYRRIVSKLCDCYHPLKDNPSKTYDLDNNQQLIRKYNGTPWRKSKDSQYEGIAGLGVRLTLPVALFANA